MRAAGLSIASATLALVVGGCSATHRSSHLPLADVCGHEHLTSHEACQLRPADKHGVQFESLYPALGCVAQYLRPPYACYLRLTLHNYTKRTVTDLVVRGDFNAERNLTRHVQIAIGVDGHWRAAARYVSVAAPPMAPGSTLNLEVLATSTEQSPDPGVTDLDVLLDSAANRARYGQGPVFSTRGFPCVEQYEADEACE